MKVFIFVPCYILLILFSVFVHGDLQLGLGIGIGNTANKVTEDIRPLLQIFPTRRTINEGSIVFRDSEEDVPAYLTSRPPTVTPGAPVQRVEDVVTTTPTVITTTSTGKTNDSEKDGRENFAGGCRSGFLRTSDGRCMPTFL